jgi:hypothetical protein
MRLAEGAEGNLAPARPGYRSQIRLPLVLALTVITAAAGLWGWVLHPSSSGFEAVPQDLQILVSGTGFSATETMTQTAGGVTLEVSQLGGQGYRPLRNADAFTVIEGPTGQGAADVRAYSNAQENGVAQVNGRHIANQSWAFLVLDPGGAHPCDGSARYTAGTISLPLRASTGGLVVQPNPVPPSTGDTIPPPALCLHWTSGAPVGLSGPYLNARFPPLQGLTPGTPLTEVPVVGDVGDAGITRVLNLAGGNTAGYSVQSDPHPVPLGTSTWTWTTVHSPQVIELTAVNTSDSQRESNNAFYSGILIGIAGGALISLLTELVVPLSRKPGGA